MPLRIKLLAPDDLHTPEIDEDFKVEDNDGSDDDGSDDNAFAHHLACSR